jgi:cell division transport system permease protein
MRQLRIGIRILVETLIGLRQSGWSNWLVISILAIALTIFGGVLQLTMTLKNVVTTWGSQLEISAYLKDAPPDNPELKYDPKKVAQEVRVIPGVQLVEIVPKETAWQEMQSNFKVAALSNPLPNTLHIKVASPEKVEEVAQRIKLLAGVENVRYPMKVARRLNEIRHFLEIAGFSITAALTCATLTVIGNAINLVIQSRRREIEILSLMGVSPSYIKSPLILQGATYGFVASLVAIGVLWGINFYINPYFNSQLIGFAPIMPQSLEYSLVQTFLALLGLGVLVGAGGGAWTSGRYIKI